jgi:hypothetical protein
MIPKREIKIIPREKKLVISKVPDIQSQIGGTAPPDVGQMVRDFLNSHRPLSQKIKNVLMEISDQLKGVTDIIIAYRIIDSYIMKNSNEFVTGKLKELILHLARSLPGALSVIPTVTANPSSTVSPKAIPPV